MVVNLSCKLALIDLPGVTSLGDLRCVAIPFDRRHEAEARCPNPVFRAHVWREEILDEMAELTHVTLSTNFEDQLLKLVCDRHLKLATWHLHPAVRVVPTGTTVRVTGLDDGSVDDILLALFRAGCRPDPLGDIAFTAICPVDGAMLLVSDDEGVSCGGGCSVTAVLEALATT